MSRPPNNWILHHRRPSILPLVSGRFVSQTGSPSAPEYGGSVSRMIPHEVKRPAGPDPFSDGGLFSSVDEAVEVTRNVKVNLELSRKSFLVHSSWMHSSWGLANLFWGGTWGCQKFLGSPFFVFYWFFTWQFFRLNHLHFPSESKVSMLISLKICAYLALYVSLLKYFLFREFEEPFIWISNLKKETCNTTWIAYFKTFK